MSCLTSLIGGTIGFMLGGPIGAIGGAALGSLAGGLGSTKYSEKIGRRLSSAEHAQMTFFIGAFSMLAKLASADGHVSAAERASIQEFMERDLNLNPESKKSALRVFETAINSPEPFENFAEQFYREFKIQPQLLDMMIDIMVRVSVADKDLSSGEERLILSAVNIFHFSEAKYKAIKLRHFHDLDGYYAVLGCNKKESPEQIKKAYRKLVSEFHPDMIASKGLPEEFTKFANNKFREIQEAYEFIRKDLSF